MVHKRKKSLTPGLTPSRKRRRRAARLDLVDWRDAADDHCFRLDMIAELLQACGEPLEPAVLENVGGWVSREVEALQTLLNQLGEAR